MAETPADQRDLPSEYLWLEGGQRYCICAFYTPNYLPQIRSLKASAEALGINHYFKCYAPRGGWEANTRIKAEFVDHALKRLPRHDVVYLDADAVIRQPLSLFDEPSADVVMLFDHRRIKNLNVLRIAAGTLLVRNTDGGRRFAERWAAEAAKARPLDLDEDLIYRMFPSLEGTTFSVLPRPYSKIFDAPGADPVIEHFQASRGQFKWRKAFRRARQIGTIIAAAALIALIWWLSTRMVSLSWR